MTALSRLSVEIRQYLIVTGNYWAFTLTDGALRMLVVLHFYALGYSPLEIAMLFLFYEFFGVVTNLVGGWLGAKYGLNKTMNIGLFIQILALSMLLVPNENLTVMWVMAAQALSGIAKDLNKMSAKSAIKLLVPDDAQDKLYRWVAILTGSKNALKGVGFFLGGALLTLIGFKAAILFMALGLFAVWLFSLVALNKEMGRAKYKPKFSQIFSKSRSVNILSAARLFLFSARDIWFVVALPVYLSTQLGWNHWYVGGFLAIWVIGYGFVQSVAPKITGKTSSNDSTSSHALFWALILSLIPAAIAIALYADWYPVGSLLIGLMIFGVLFAINSALHSYLIVSFADAQGVSLDVGFYYMANAMGRLIGTVLSGWLFQSYGLEMCLAISAIFIAIVAWISYFLPNKITTPS
ncbi:Permease of the major facilitator superfamily [Methylophaga frappieri]|uniref:Permease of the major facilitator superfamily n=1 Tax=Methylophaga frappieri (strain ATCC BAA-2434 / DSM 25690 / JAM7) TaxID=754477 RepID=I1YK02_METFJ|nr:organoarsenical effux MFS transporter ArsJ [Methylophaga frappieri]AFJ03245.1 Permease of the major facilitator superfamily [Methylophaga frappieri]